MMIDRPFILQCPNGPNAKKYFVQGDFTGIVWCELAAEAARFNLEDAYGNLACVFDMCRDVVIPINVGGASEEECKRLGARAANDMFVSPKPDFVAMWENGLVRRSLNESLDEPPQEIPPGMPPTGSQMSVWEYFARAVNLHPPDRSAT